MVEIIYLGHASFRFVGKSIAIVTDPFSDEALGLKYPRTEADVVTVSHEHEDHNNRAGVRGNFICFDSPGEYEIKGTEIIGIKSFHDDVDGEERGKNTIFTYELDGIKICHLGDLGHELSGEQIEKINGVDVLILPIGGKYTIDPKKAARIISTIGPKIVIPAHYKAGKMTELGSVEEFIKEMGVEAKKLKELKIKQKDLPEGVEIYLLEPRSK